MTQESAAYQLDQLDMSLVLGLETDFDRRFGFLFTLLSAKRQQAVLSGLLLRLDFNSHIQRTAPLPA